jgi:hypothetical protein
MIVGLSQPPGPPGYYGPPPPVVYVEPERPRFGGGLLGGILNGVGDIIDNIAPWRE